MNVKIRDSTVMDNSNCDQVLATLFIVEIYSNYSFLCLCAFFKIDVVVTVYTVDDVNAIDLNEHNIINVLVH